LSMSILNKSWKAIGYFPEFSDEYWVAFTPQLPHPNSPTILSDPLSASQAHAIMPKLWRHRLTDMFVALASQQQLCTIIKLTRVLATI